MMNVSTEDEIMITILKMTENSSFIIHHSSFTLQGSNHRLQNKNTNDQLGRF
jgi:hypothetical protein